MNNTRKLKKLISNGRICHWIHNYLPVYVVVALMLLSLIHVSVQHGGGGEGGRDKGSCVGP